MNIKIENQDLFTVPQGYYLAHCISADFALGAGIAKKFTTIFDMKNKLNSFYSDYTFDNEGDALLVDNVFNLVTKERYWHKPTYKSLTEALVSMRDQMDYLGIKKVAMPKIGCGLDRLDWENVYEIIEDCFCDSDIEILICVLS